MKPYDAVIVLGGGRNKDGTLTSLSHRRLELGQKYVNAGRAINVVVMGGRYKSLTPNKGLHDIDGFELRTEYLITHGVSHEKITPVRGEECRDTIYEAFASRRVVRNKGWSRIALATSIHHKERALTIFRKIYGSEVTIDIVDNPCEDDISENMEAALIKLTKPLLDFVLENEGEPSSWDEWYSKHKSFYDYQQHLHDEIKRREGVLSEAHATIWDDKARK